MKRRTMMKITAIDIYGYGKWSDTSFEPLSEFAVFYGKNEAGKTTLMSFIHSILFGFPTKQSSESRYEPMDSSRYGGKLKLNETIHGEVIVERIRGKANGDVTVTLEDGTVGEDKLLEQLLYGVDKEMYRSLFSFDLKGIEDVQKMSPKKLNRYFLSVGTLGNEQLLKAADLLETKAGNYYKPTGRVPVINKKIRQVEEKRKKLNAAKEKNEEYSNLLKQQEKLESELKKMKEDESKFETNLKHLHRLKSNWHYLVEKKEIKNTMKIEKLQDLPEDGLFQLQVLNDQMQETREKMAMLQEKLVYLNEKLTSSPELNFFDDHQKEVEEVWEQLPWVTSKYKQLEKYKKQLHEEESLFFQQKIKAGLPLDAAVPSPISKNAAASLHSLYTEIENIEIKIDQLQERIRLTDYQNKTVMEQLDKIEQKLWENRELQEKEDELEKQKKQITTYNHNERITKDVKIEWKPIILFLLGLATASIGWKLSGMFGIIVMVTGIVVSLSSVYNSLNQSKKKKAEEITFNDKNQIDLDLQESLFQQKEYRAQWREKLAEGDQAAIELNELRGNIKDAESEKQRLQKKQEEWKANHLIPEHISFRQLEENSILFDRLRQHETEIENKKLRINELKQETKQWEQKAALLENVLYLDWQYLPGVVNKIEEMKQTIENTLIEQEELVKEEREIHDQIKQWVSIQKELDRKRKQLFKKVNTDHEEAFRKKYEVFEKLVKQKERLELLESEFAKDEKEFEKFKTQDEVNEQIQKNEKKIQLIKQTREEKVSERVNCSLALKQLEEGGNYSILLQETANLESELQELVDQWSSFKTASFLIEQTLAHAKKDRFPETINNTSEFFNLLTKGAYEKVLIRENEIMVQHQDGTLFYSSDLSTGTAEQLYVALRFAFVKNTLDVIQLPLVIDAGFVNFDNARKQEVLKLMKKMSNYTQILYFTFDESIKKMVQKEEIEVLY